MNLGQIRQRIQNLGYTVDTAAQQTDFINAEYNNVHGKERWPFLETVLVVPAFTVAGTPNYTLPMDDWRNLDAIRIGQATANNFPMVNYLNPQELFDRLQQDQLTNATPEIWTYYANQVWFYPVPDAAYDITINYMIEPPDLVSDDDVPLIPVPYHDVLVWGAIERMAMRERDWLGRQFAQQEKELLLGRLEREYRLRQRQTSSEVKRSGYWNTQINYPLSSTGF